MSGSNYLGKRAEAFSTGDAFDEYSAVELAVTDELAYYSGSPTGRTLKVDCPWGTQTMADNILAKIRGYRYQPFNATRTNINLVAELGDGVTIEDTYGGIYSMATQYGPLTVTDLSSPAEEEIDHEFTFKPKSDRKIYRRISQAEASFKIQADQITANVMTREGGSASSFGWNLTDKDWKIYSSSKTVLSVTKDTLKMEGEITATSGKIGNFAITSDYLSYNKRYWASGDSGIYLGIYGIRCGNDFKVDTSGNLTAMNGEFRGSISAKRIEYGGDYGTMSGSGITSGSLYTSRMSTGINTSLGYADFSHDVFNGVDTAVLMKCREMIFDGRFVERKSVTINGETLNYLGWIAGTGGT